MKHLRKYLIRSKSLLAMLALDLGNHSSAAFIDSTGHYSIRGEGRQNPDFHNGASVQIIEQSFRLRTEIRTGDKASFFGELRLFGPEERGFLGDTSSQDKCPASVPNPANEDGLPVPSNRGSTGSEDGSCVSGSQNLSYPGYSSYLPQISSAYGVYAGETCLTEVGRRPRHWGMGAFLNSGTNAFDSHPTYFDGITCKINLQKASNLGFSFGYDKITETGGSLTSGVDSDEAGQRFGARNQDDDVDQLFFTIEYRDGFRAGSIGKNVGIYFANLIGKGDQGTDIKFADLYTNIVFSDLIIQNEIIFRLGKTANPSFVELGGAASASKNEILRNDVQSIAATGKFEYFLAKSGSLVGPAQIGKGNFSSHSLYLEYVFAPGDKNGYEERYKAVSGASGTILGSNRTDRKASAFAFHPDYQVALILFNGRDGSGKYRVDGIFDPGQIMNSTVVSLGYSYRSILYGNFTAKFIKAQLNSTPNAEDKLRFEEARNSQNGGVDAPIGTNGNDLGWELDLLYTYDYDQGISLNGALGYAQPGDAWDTEAGGNDPVNSFIVQGGVTFNF